jgi:hypothetical protein
LSDQDELSYSIPHYFVKGFTPQFTQRQFSSTRQALRKFPIPDVTIDQYMEDIRRGVPRHPILGKAFFHYTPDQTNQEMEMLASEGVNVEACSCLWGDEVVRWNEDGDPLDSWIAVSKGVIKSAFELVRENLPTRDTCLWASPAVVVDMGVRADGCIVVTDSHIAVGYHNDELKKVYSMLTSRSGESEVEQLRGAGDGVSMRIRDIQLQSQEISHGAFFTLEAALASGTQRKPKPDISGETATLLPPLDAMKQLQEMLDLGYVSNAEFEEKKQEILSRL